MSVTKSLPVIMPELEGQRWSCHSCGNCCRSLVVHLTGADRGKIDEQGWGDRLDVDPFVRLGRGWALNKRADGACVFLDESNRCRIHSEFGESAKPLACRIFPFSVHRADDAWQATLRYDCPSVIASRGEPIGQHQGALKELVGEMAGGGAPRTTELQRGLIATRKEIDDVVGHYQRILTDESMPLGDRIVSGARTTSTLASATLTKVRGVRLAELLDLVFRATAGELGGTIEQPTRRQSGMLRQVVFAHTEHVTLATRRASIGRRFLMRGRQLRDARAFLAGRGVVPAIEGIPGAATFDAVESISAASEDSADVEELMARYLLARLASKTIFGSGYHDWPIFAGLTALFVSVAAIGWLARYAAAAEGRAALGLDDVARAIGIVDRAATRLPALGTMTERARMAYLVRDDGVARLVRMFLPFK